jgi:hypothetical protein
VAPTHTVTSDLPDSESKGRIEVDWTADRNSPIVRGDLANVLEVMKKYCKLVWHEDWWHCAITDVETIRQMCEQFSYKFVEILPNDPEPEKRKRAAKQQASTPKATETKAPKPRSAAEPEYLKGRIGAFKEKTTKNGNPFLSVLIIDGKQETWLTCFNRHVNDIVKQNKGKSGEFICQHLGQQYPALLGMKELDGVEYEDYYVPVIQRATQTAGQRTLY